MDSAVQSATLVANGNILPCSFVTPDTSNDYYFLPASSGAAMPAGVSYRGSDNYPLNGSTQSQYLAVAGEPFPCFVTPGQRTLLYLSANGSGCARGDLLMPDSTSQAITHTTGNYYGARSLQSGNAGDLIEVEIEKGYE